MKQLKHLRCALWRTLICLTAVITCISSAGAANFNKNTTLYFKISNSDWKKDNAQFAANFNMGTTSAGNSVKLDIVDDDYYSCTVPGDYPHVQLQRLDPNNNTDVWNYSNNFNQAPGNGQNCLELASSGWNNINLSWTSYNSTSIPANLYLLGINDIWDPSKPTDMGTANDGMFTKEVTLDKESSFSFSEKKSTSKDDWDSVNSGLRYGPVTDTKNGSETLELTNNTVTSGIKTWPVGTGDASTWKLAAGIYTFNVNFSVFPATLTVTKKVEEIPAGEYDIYLVRSRDWNNPEKLEFTNGSNSCTITRDMNANGEFGFRVVSKGDKPTTDNQKYWYAKGDDNVVKAGTNTYTLVNTGTHNFKLPNQGGSYTFTITRDDNGLPKEITIKTPEITQYLPDLFIGGSWISGQSDNLTGKADRVTQSNGKYVDYVVSTSNAGAKFRFYQKSVSDKLGNWMGPNSDTDFTFTDAGLDSSTTYTTVGNDKVYILPKAGTYTIRVESYDADKTVKFTISYAAPEQHLYLGATFKGDLDDPEFQLDNGETFKKVRFTKNTNDDTFMFRFACAFDRDHWIGPSDDTEIPTLSASERTFTSTTASATSQKFYKINNPGVYELEVKSWNNYTVNFTLTYIEAVEEGTPYYFVGDMNDWYSTEFTVPGGGTSMEKFYDERDNWKFRKVKAGEEVPAGVDTNWYVFDNFPGKQLSGQFQITSGDKNIWTEAEVYGHGSGLNEGNMWNDNNATLIKYLSRPISDKMITEQTSLRTQQFAITRRVKTGGSFANFHMECNAVDDAKIYFKPGENADMMVTGTPRHFFVFYANTAGDGSDGTITAKINDGKPNIHNYFLPGIEHDGKQIPNYVDADGNTAPHMHIGDGVELTKLEFFKQNEGKTAEEITTYLTGLGIDQADASLIANEGKLPNGRLVNSFEHLYIARIPAGFENPAGWKYTLSLPKALTTADRLKSVTIACNHIYFMPAIDGVCVHLNDEAFLANKDNYVVDPETGAKTPLSDYDVMYYYRVYYSKPTTDGTNYQIMIVDHQPGNIVKEEYPAYSSNTDTRKPTFEETGRKLEFGWKPLNAYTNPAAVNATITTGSTDKGWLIEDGNLTDITDTETNWHICWVNSGDRMRRQRIPKEYSNAYIQILAVYFKKDNADNPLLMKTTRSGETSDAIEAKEFPAVTAELLASADHKSIEPGALTFNNDVFHHPLQGNHLYYVLNNDSGVWTGVEEIEYDFNGNTVEADVNAVPAYYNLQGVRVAKPVKGIYIEVRGNRSRKVIY